MARPQRTGNPQQGTLPNETDIQQEAAQDQQEQEQQQQEGEDFDPNAGGEVLGTEEETEGEYSEEELPEVEDTDLQESGSVKDLDNMGFDSLEPNRPGNGPLEKSALPPQEQPKAPEATETKETATAEQKEPSTESAPVEAVNDNPFRDDKVYARKKDNQKEKTVFSQQTWDLLGADKAGWEPDFSLPKAVREFRNKKGIE